MHEIEPSITLKLLWGKGYYQEQVVLKTVNGIVGINISVQYSHSSKCHLCQLS